MTYLCSVRFAEICRNCINSGYSLGAPAKPPATEKTRQKRQKDQKLILGKISMTCDRLPVGRNWQKCQKLTTWLDTSVSSSPGTVSLPDPVLARWCFETGCPARATLAAVESHIAVTRTAHHLNVSP